MGRPATERILPYTVHTGSVVRMAKEESATNRTKGRERGAEKERKEP